MRGASRPASSCISIQLPPTRAGVTRRMTGRPRGRLDLMFGPPPIHARWGRRAKATTARPRSDQSAVPPPLPSPLTKTMAGQHVGRGKGHREQGCVNGQGHKPLRLVDQGKGTCAVPREGPSVPSPERSEVSRPIHGYPIDHEPPTGIEASKPYQGSIRRRVDGESEGGRGRVHELVRGGLRAEVESSRIRCVKG